MPVDLDEREKKIDELTDQIRGIPIECGMKNSADCLLEPYLKDNTEKNRAFITRMFQKYACRKDYGVLAPLLDAIQFHMYEQEPKYLDFVDSGLAMPPECQEQALAIIEQWRTKECLFILNKNIHKISGTWMRTYALRVLWELRVEFLDAMRQVDENRDLYSLKHLLTFLPNYGFGFKDLYFGEYGQIIELSPTVPIDDKSRIIPSVRNVLESIWKFHRNGIESVTSEYHPSNKDPNNPHIDVTVTFKPGYLYQNAAAMTFDGEDQECLSELRLMLLLWYKLNGMLPVWIVPDKDLQYVTKDPAPEGSSVEYTYGFYTISGRREPDTSSETY